MTRDIYVSTIIDSHNYGTVMQAVATKEALTPYGRPLFIDYTRPDWTAQGLRDRYLKDESHNALTNVARFCLRNPICGGIVAFSARLLRETSIL